MVPPVHGRRLTLFLDPGNQEGSFIITCPPIPMEEGDSMNVSHAELYQFCTLIIMVIRLVMDIKKK
jgi:hypothetical protein